MKGGRSAVGAVELLRKAFREFYRSMTLLQSFGVMNSTAFAKITKKHDKHIRTRFTMRLAPLLKDMEFEKQTRLVPMISTAEVRALSALCAG